MQRVPSKDDVIETHKKGMISCPKILKGEIIRNQNYLF
jgi:hypothetical protein